MLHVILCRLSDKLVSLLLSRLKVETDDVLRKRPAILASSQGPVKLQDVPHSSSSLSISQGPSLNGVKKDIIRGLNFKPKDTELANSRSKLDSGIKGPQDVQPKAEGLARERNWPHGLATKGLRKDPKLVQFSRSRDSSGRCILEKCKRIQFVQGCSSDKLTQEPLPAQRRKIHFRIPIRTRSPLQRLMKENAFISEAHESKAEEEEKKGGLGTIRMEPISQLSPAESTFKPPLRTSKGKEQELQKGTETRPGGDESEVMFGTRQRLGHCQGYSGEVTCLEHKQPELASRWCPNHQEMTPEQSLE